MAKLFDRAGQQIGSFATTGDTTITLGAALPADTTNGDLITLAAAGAVAGDSINYLIQEGSKWEIGTGALGGTSPTFTLTRGPVKTWSGSAVGTTTPLVFTTAAKVYCVPASGLDNEWRGNFSGGLPGGSGPFILARTVDTYSYSSRMVLDAGGNAYFADNAGGNIGIGFRNNDLVPGLRLPIGGAISWSGINDARDAATTALWQDGANILAQKNNTNGQTFRIYGSADSNSAPVNYTLLSVKHAGGTAGAVIKTEAGGTGTAGSLGLGGATVDLSSYRPASDFQGKISFNYYLNAATGTPTNTWDVRNNGGITMQFWANGSFGFNFDGGGVRTTGMLGFTNSAANGFTTALKETSAGIIEINNGTASSSAITNLRDLKIRSLILGNGAAGSITFADGTTQSTAATGGGGAADPSSQNIMYGGI